MILSVLMTSYNRERYIAESIESLLLSSFTDFELIIVDDGSKDNTAKIASEFALKDSRIKLYINDSNIGQFQNRNRAAALAKGTYIKYLDSDDKVMPYGLQYMVNEMLKHPDCGIGIEYDNNCSKPFNIRFPCILSSKQSYLWHFELNGIMFPGPTASIFKKADFDYVGGYSTDIGSNADVDLNLKIASISKVLLLANGNVFWRQHDQSVSAGQLADDFQMLIERYNINMKILTDNSSPLSSKDQKRIKFSLEILYLRNAINKYLLKGELMKFIELLKKANISPFKLAFIFLPLRLLRKTKHFSII